MKTLNEREDLLGLASNHLKVFNDVVTLMSTVNLQHPVNAPQPGAVQGMLYSSILKKSFFKCFQFFSFSIDAQLLKTFDELIITTEKEQVL